MYKLAPNPDTIHVLCCVPIFLNHAKPRDRGQASTALLIGASDNYCSTGNYPAGHVFRPLLDVGRETVSTW